MRTRRSASRRPPSTVPVWGRSRREVGCTQLPSAQGPFLVFQIIFQIKIYTPDGMHTHTQHTHRTLDTQRSLNDSCLDYVANVIGELQHQWLRRT
jgi:hypothetical protein